MMMLVIDYINVQTKGIWNKKLQKKSWLQIIIAAFLGIIPGCLGAFTVVSLFTHRVVGFAALVTAMIATFGDEAFVMFAMMPGKAFIVLIVVFGVAILSGFIILFIKKEKTTDNSFGFEVHHEEELCHCFPGKKIFLQLKNISFERSLLLFSFSVFVILIFLGELGPEKWDWKRITFIIGGLITIFIVSTVPDHFIKDHLWGHVIKKHLFRIFLWTFAAILLIHFLQEYINVEDWVSKNIYFVLLIAVLIGIIPESGPHLIFITLFINGTIPLSILIASSIVQDGHGALPLFAESKKSFVYMKLINVAVGLVVGSVLLFFNM